jgi:7,8-dihydropterin-6-yl-methyl-4-(beta-D-ribofuranosyl)aminobenzene 5'-phosphate synthase
MSEMSRLARFSGTLLLIVGGRAALGSPPQSASPSPAGREQITILYDAFGKPGPMQKDWGYAALVEYGGKRILFDTGNNPDILRIVHLTKQSLAG